MRFTSTTIVRPSSSLHKQVDGPDVGRVLAADQCHVVAQRRDPRREQLLQLGLDAVLLEPGIVAERMVVSCSDLEHLDAQGLALRRPRRDHAVALLDGARRVHPVERLVGLRVGVDGDRAVGLEQDQPSRRGASRAPSRPWYSTAQRATSNRTARA